MSSVISKLEELSRSASRKGASTSQVSTVVSSIVELNDAIDKLIKYAECLASSKGGCSQLNSASFCSSQCGSTFYIKEGDSVKIWRVGNGAISIVKGPDTLSVSSKSFGLQVSADSFRARVWNSVVTGSLEADQLASGSGAILHAARKLLTKVKLASDSLASCAREQGIKC